MVADPMDRNRSVCCDAETETRQTNKDR